MSINPDNRKILVVAPHPDDETLGVGGTLLRRKSEGFSVAWLIVTGVTEGFGWSSQRVIEREREVSSVSDFFDFDEVHNLGLPTTKLDTLPFGEIVQSISQVVNSYRPSEIYIPHLGDVHTDHAVVHNAVVSCTKSFRYPFVGKLLSYETLSETDFGLDNSRQFSPNVFVDISEYLDGKLSAMEIYGSEMGEFPFPRSRESITALAQYRGSTAGFRAAEAFQLLRSRE
ncbi:MAG: PIG-L family deacetylase [Gammaproteobacteria bacterium]|nr:PIG-L family deacetylase [Gammaproteobacteria bacterium]